MTQQGPSQTARYRSALLRGEATLTQANRDRLSRPARKAGRGKAASRPAAAEIASAGAHRTAGGRCGGRPSAAPPGSRALRRQAGTGTEALTSRRPPPRAAGRAGRDAGRPPLPRGSDGNDALPRAAVTWPVAAEPLGARSCDPSPGRGRPVRQARPARNTPDRDAALLPRRPPLTAPVPRAGSALLLPAALRTAPAAPSPARTTAARRASRRHRPIAQPMASARHAQPAPRHPPRRRSGRRTARGSIRSGEHAISPWAARQWATALCGPGLLIGRRQAAHLHTPVARATRHGGGRPAAERRQPPRSHDGRRQVMLARTRFTAALRKRVITDSSPARGDGGAP